MLNNPVFQFVLAHLSALLYSAYGTMFVLISTMEYLIPRRLPIQSRWRRWGSNLSLYLIDLALLLSLSTLTITNLAYFTWKNHWGLLNRMPFSPWVQIVLSLLSMDLLVYATHVLFHKVPWGWRVHRVHHLDRDMDSSTGVLFHPLEGLVSFIVRQPFVLLVGPHPLAVPLFDAVFVVSLLLTHANIRLPAALEGALRLVLVTPDVHRVHHSTDWGESNSNYGFTLCWWDRIFGTYRAKPDVAAEKMELGLREFQSAREIGLLRRLAFPFLAR